MKTVLVTPNSNTVIPVMEDTQYVVDLSAKKGEYSLDLHFEKEGVEAEIIAVYTSTKDDDLKLTTIATHKVPHTKCNTLVRGVLFDGGKSSYTGKILITKPAQQTSSYLDDAVLVVGNNTQNHSQPILEIEADDVKASHGATTGRIDENQIYYLTSRGLSKEEATHMIIQGFFESILSVIHNDSVREKVRANINVKSY